LYNEEEHLQLSGIQHFAYCPRQWALAYLEMQWNESLRTYEGRLMHDRVHEAANNEKRGDILIVRGMKIYSRTLGISGECDVVEFHLSDTGVSLHGREGFYKVIPIEYKRGKPKEHDADILQLCAQTICIEEMLLCDISQGYLFYGETKRRIEVMLDTELRLKVKKNVCSNARIC